jgi:Eukaryotic glutathione synthase, ATP binding domain
MIHDDDSGGQQIKQVEMNTIAAGGAGLASANTKLHRYFAILPLQ